MSNTTTLAKAENKLSLRETIETPQFADAVAKALPKHLTPDRFIRIACTTMLRTPALAHCDKASFLNALLTCSQLGIEPDGRRAHLIPFENRKTGKTECQLILDYKGLSELAMRSGIIANLHADKVCERDAFEYDRGTIVKHTPNFREARGKAYAYYAIAKFKDGTEKAEVMTLEEVEAIRKRSRAGNFGPWQTDFDEMAKKTVFRRLSKWLPLSPDFRDAVEAEDETAATIEAPKAVFAARPVFQGVVQHSGITVIHDPIHEIVKSDEKPSGDLESLMAEHSVDAKTLIAGLDKMGIKPAKYKLEQFPDDVIDWPAKLIKDVTDDFGFIVDAGKEAE